MIWTLEQERMQEAGQFIDTLIKNCFSDVNAVVQRKNTEKFDTTNWALLDFYEKQAEGS